MDKVAKSGAKEGRIGRTVARGVRSASAVRFSDVDAEALGDEVDGKSEFEDALATVPDGQFDPSRFVPSVGPLDADVMLVGEAPGEREIDENQPTGIVTASNETGSAHHKVRYSLRMLEKEDLIEPSSHGTVTTGRGNMFLTHIHQTLDEVAITVRDLKGIT